MPTDCSPALFGFAAVERRKIACSMEGASCRMPGGFYLVRPDRAIGSSSDLRPAFRDTGGRDLIEDAVATLVGQRTFGIALGYEDLNDHDHLRHDWIMTLLEPRRGAAAARGSPRPQKGGISRRNGAGLGASEIRMLKVTGHR
jgi:hypothetical protein